MTVCLIMFRRLIVCRYNITNPYAVKRLVIKNNAKTNIMSTI